MKMSNKELLNWLPKLAYVKNNFFLAAASLLVLLDFSKGIFRFPWVFCTLLD